MQDMQRLLYREFNKTQKTEEEIIVLLRNIRKQLTWRVIPNTIYYIINEFRTQNISLVSFAEINFASNWPQSDNDLLLIKHLKHF